MKGQSITIPPTLRAAVVCMLIAAATATALGVSHVARRQQVIRLGYELSEAITELRQLEEENRRLRLEKSVLTNPERVELLARAMGMTQPTSGQFRVIVPAGPAELAAAEPGAAWPVREASRSPDHRGTP